MRLFWQNLTLFLQAGPQSDAVANIWSNHCCFGIGLNGLLAGKPAAWDQHVSEARTYCSRAAVVSDAGQLDHHLIILLLLHVRFCAYALRIGVQDDLSALEREFCRIGSNDDVVAVAAQDVAAAGF